MYIAANNGDGIYRMTFENFDFDSPSSSTVVFEYAGPSVRTTKNDGMNCLKASDPYKVACPENSSPQLPLVYYNASDCKCNAGHTGPDGGTCDACEAGKYKNTTGSADCSTCPAGGAWLQKRGGTRCICVTSRPSFICDCLETQWRENR